MRWQGSLNFLRAISTPCAFFPSKICSLPPGLPSVEVCGDRGVALTFRKHLHTMDRVSKEYSTT